jgi:hypothetical protein
MEIRSIAEQQRYCNVLAILWPEQTTLNDEHVEMLEFFL